MLSVGLCQVSLSYLSAAERAASWSQYPAGLQPGSEADCRCCWPPAGGSAESQGGTHDIRSENRSTGLKQLSGLERENAEARLPHQHWKGQPEYLWACVASQCCRSELQRGRRAWFRLMERQARITVQLRAEHLREETHREREEIRIKKCW